MIQKSYHEPVLLDTVVGALRVEKGNRYIDATLGGGGHASAILERGGVVLGIDQDPDAIAYCKKKFGIPDSEYGIPEKIILAQGNFEHLEEIAQKHGFGSVAGILFDLGMSSHQIDGSGRGFSYSKDEVLDMRMDGKGEVTAAEIINRYREEELYEIFASYAEELNSRAIAHAIIRARTIEPITTTRRLRDIIEKVPGVFAGQGVSARIFQALRISVNREIEVLKVGIANALPLLERKGRLVVLSYHSLEDRVIKMVLKDRERKRLGNEIGRLMRPTHEETKRNTRARSARLRIFEAL